MLVISSFILFLSILLLLLPTILLERIFLGSVQNRFGSNISGLFGLLQSAIDGLKTFFKQILFLKTVSKIGFMVLPVLLLFINFIRITIIPFSSTVDTFDFIFDILLFYFFSGLDALIFISTVSIFFKSKFSKLSISREAIQLCTLEIILGICFLTIILVSGTSNIRLCVEIQTPIWFIMILTPFSILFLLSILGGLHRTPFDVTEAEAELTAGYQTEFSGLLFSVFYLSEYCGIIVSSLLFTNFFLGGYHAPTTNSNLNLTLKLSFTVVLIVFIRAAMPRIRIQSILYVSWIYLIPLLTGVFLFFLFSVLLVGPATVGLEVNIVKSY